LWHVTCIVFLKNIKNKLNNLIKNWSRVLLYYRLVQLPYFTVFSVTTKITDSQYTYRYSWISKIPRPEFLNYQCTECRQSNFSYYCIYNDNCLLLTTCRTLENVPEDYTFRWEYMYSGSIINKTVVSCFKTLNNLKDLIMITNRERRMRCNTSYNGNLLDEQKHSTRYYIPLYVVCTILQQLKFLFACNNVNTNKNVHKLRRIHHLVLDGSENRERIFQHWIQWKKTLMCALLTSTIYLYYNKLS
jgi:hypothetical protein